MFLFINSGVFNGKTSFRCLKDCIIDPPLNRSDFLGFLNANLSKKLMVPKSNKGSPEYSIFFPLRKRLAKALTEG